MQDTRVCNRESCLTAAASNGSKIEHSVDKHWHADFECP
jgi:hypothetical protein